MFFIFYIFIFLFGLIIGSFLNCLIYRLEKEESIKGRSYCPHCSHNLIWKDLVPVFSFLLLGGKCRYCNKKISWQYPLVEILTGLVFLLILNQFEILNFINLLFYFYISSVLIIIFIYDLKYFIIPDKVLFPAIIITFFYRLFENLLNWVLIDNWSLKIENFYYIFNFFIAAFIASVFFLVIFLISKGKWIGFGDVKLAILLGLILGFPNILIGLFLAFFFGAIIGVGLMLFGKKGLTPLEVKESRGKSLKSRLLTGLKSEIPFGPFLITGTFVTMFWGQEIFNWYMHLLTFNF